MEIFSAGAHKKLISYRGWTKGDSTFDQRLSRSPIRYRALRHRDWRIGIRIASNVVEFSNIVSIGKGRGRLVAVRSTRYRFAITRHFSVPFSSMNFSFGNESIVAQLCALEFAGTIYSRPSIPWIPWRSRIYRINRFLNSFFSPLPSCQLSSQFFRDLVSSKIK